MRPLDTRSPPLVHAVIVALVAATFVADYLTPLGVAVWVFYVTPLALSVKVRTPSTPLLVALAAIVLIGVAAITDPPGMSRSVAITNRAMGSAVIAAVAILVRQLIAARLASEREDWLRRAQTGILEAVQGELVSDQVGERALRMLAEAVDGVVGAFYLATTGQAVLLAGLALDRTRVRETYAPGEGLVGEALRSRAVVAVDGAAEEGFLIDGGVGAVPSRALLVAPLWADGHPVGVIALGSSRRFGDRDRALAERVAESIAVAARTADYRRRLHELLAETQRQAEELQAQQEELRVSNEELEGQGSALRESRTQLEEQQAELEQVNAILEEKATELKRQRDEVEGARRTAERANEHKSEFLANMSHELRTPLNSALILARLLADNRDGNLSEDQIRHAETIYSAGNDLLALINDILDLSKIEAGRVDVEIEDVAPRRLVAQLEPVFEPVARQRSLVFSVEVGPDLPPTVATDGRLLQQILRNLLSNAFKFTHQGAVTLAISRAADGVRFAVRDTGIGVAPEQQRVIFDPFRQADGATSRKYGGTGLGLSISRELARLLGADIELESALGRGSTFSLVIPGVPPAQRGAPRPDLREPAAREPAALRSRRADGNGAAPARTAAYLPDDRDDRRRPGRLILAVEDDPAFARILYDLVRERDFDCVLAGTAAEGLKLAGEIGPCGILLDVSLPDGSGLSVLEQLKRDGRTRHIPVHVVSVNDFSRTAMELGAVGYALKPVERDEIFKALGRIEDRMSKKARRVLIVEDDERLRESTCALLGGEGVELVPVGTVAGALAELAGSTFDCMVLDLKLPDGSGFDLLERMATDEDYSFPPVIVHTGRDLSRADEDRLRRYSRSIIVKGARSPERLLDEVTLFLHQVESTMPPERQKMLREARSREQAFEGRRILVVEDDVRNIFALTSILEPRGATVEIARNGREALDRLARAPLPELVLMDIMMPEMDGLTAMREIRKRAELHDLPIIALTAKAMRDDHERCLAAGASDYMAKPLDVQRLLSLCRVWLPRSA